YRETRVDERARFGHNQIGLKILSAKRRGVQVRKSRRVVVDRIKSSHLQCVACLVLPGLKMHGFSRADADQNSQDFYAGSSLRHRWIEAVTALFDCRKMEPCRIRDHLKQIIVAC